MSAVACAGATVCEGDKASSTRTAFRARGPSPATYGRRPLPLRGRGDTAAAAATSWSPCVETRVPLRTCEQRSGESRVTPHIGWRNTKPMQTNAVDSICFCYHIWSCRRMWCHRTMKLHNWKDIRDRRLGPGRSASACPAAAIRQELGLRAIRESLGMTQTMWREGSRSTRASCLA